MKVSFKVEIKVKLWVTNRVYKENLGQHECLNSRS